MDDDGARSRRVTACGVCVQLVHAGLITQRRLSRQLIYSAEYGAMNALLAYLTENCCGRDAASAPVCDPASGCCTEATAKTTVA